MKLKRLILAICVVALIVPVLTVTSCAPAGPKKVVVWSFTNEVGNMLEYYKKSPQYNAKKVEIEFVLVPNDVYQSKLDPVLQSGTDAPDVFTAESAYVKKYVDSGYWMDLTPYKKTFADNLQYTVDVATDKAGKITSLCWQATPGAYFYRRSIAKKYLGTDDPAAVQAMMDDNNKFLETADKLKVASKGKAVIVSSLGDLFNPYKAGRAQGWVVDNKLVVDPLMLTFLDQAKMMHDKGYEGRQGQWGEGWFAGMKGLLKDEKGKEIEVLGYFLPTWGLHYVLKTNSKNDDGSVNTAGDWAMVQGPIPYFWGGTWIGVRQGTKVKAEALKIVEYLGASYDFQKSWAVDQSDFVSNAKVVADIKDTFSEAFLGGQNHYAAFAEMAAKINAKILTGYDQTVESLFQEQQSAYVNGEKDLATAIKDFKAAVTNAYPDVVVD